MKKSKPVLWRAKLINRIYALVWILWIAAFLPGDRLVTIGFVLAGMVVAMIWTVLAQIQLHKINKELNKILKDFYIGPGGDAS